MLDSRTPLNCWASEPPTSRICQSWLFDLDISRPLSREAVAAEASGATKVASSRKGSSSLDLMPTNVHSIKKPGRQVAAPEFLERGTNGWLRERAAPARSNYEVTWHPGNPAVMSSLSF